MNDVVSINGRKFLGTYIDAQNGEWIPDEVVFAAGVILTMVLPQLICSAYGLLPLSAFAVTALAGSLWGLANYRRQPYPTPAFTRTGTVPQAPRGKNIRTADKDAA
jgi:hypothetical protein